VKIKIIIIVCIVLVAGCRKRNLESSDVLSKEEIIEIANKELVKEGTSLDVLKIEFDSGNKIWQEQLEYDRRENPDRADVCEDLLKNHSYQAVCYTPDMEKVVGMGRIFVFVDPQTGDVIAVCGGI
jgi:hypothetical protein